MVRSTGERSDILPVLAELFREYGFEGASLALITARTGLGKGSLYHAFPGGKEEMAAAVLADVDAWFQTHLFAPLRQAEDPRAAIRQMFVTAEAYFRSGQRMCLVGVFALGDAHDRFAMAIRAYFTAWRDALADALRRCGWDADQARAMAEDVVAGIQGALVAGRAMDDAALFGRVLRRLEARLEGQRGEYIG